MIDTSHAGQAAPDTMPHCQAEQVVLGEIAYASGLHLRHAVQWPRTMRIETWPTKRDDASITCLRRW